VNGNLLYHGCIPFTTEGEFRVITVNGTPMFGRAYMDYLDDRVRKAYFAHEENGDIMWYLWCGSRSPLFGKKRMTTFERYFIADKATHKEESDPYYKLIDDRGICEKILSDFDLSPDSSRILNGHVPVKTKDGESPIKGGGLLFFIDGGISKAYQKTTGIAGYTFIYNSRYMALAEHKPYMPTPTDGELSFDSPAIRIVEQLKQRVTVRDTDIGKELAQRIAELEALVEAFRAGVIKER
jgi:fructose-1,6-bisphosphatase-3